MLPLSAMEWPEKWHDAQEAIGKQIKAYESAILELRTRRNDYAPISKLPVELLEEVFVLAKLLSTRRFPYGSIDDRGWLNVAHVCRTWRKIALNAPRMWNRLDVSKIGELDWAVEILARSQHAPLHVKCTDSESQWAILSVVLAHMDRIEHLEVNLGRGHNSTALLKIIELIVIGTNGSPSLLQSLHLRKRAPSFSASDPVYEEIHRVFSAVQMPCLQTLDVKNFTLPPTIPIFPQLRRFSYTPPPHAKPSMASILTVLRSTPSLERLEIGSALEASDEAINENTTVELTKLSYLSYTTMQFEGSSLFCRIHYPTSARV